jgi:hypothetical protein
MTGPLRFASFTRAAIFALAATGAFAGAPGFRPYRPMTGAPRGYVPHGYRGAPWHYGGGYGYRPWGGGFGFGYPSIGFYLPLLPMGYMTVWFGGVPYYWSEGVYYTEAPYGGYVVADPPAREEAQKSPQSTDGGADPSLGTLLIIPKEGQDEERMVADRRDAQRYASEKSGYDPAHSDSSDPGTPRARKAYLRAVKLYLEDRGYSVK